MKKNYNTQKFKASTKNNISEGLRKKAELTKHLELFSVGDIVSYECKDKSLVAYRVEKVKRDVFGIYDITVIILDDNGLPGTNRFNTTADKLTRLWCQPNDRFEYKMIKKRGKPTPEDEFTGWIESIGNTGVIIIHAIEDETGNKRMFTIDALPFMTLLEELPY